MAIPLEHCGVEHQVVVHVAGDAPVHAPFEHGESLVPWEWLEGGVIVDPELALGMKEPPRSAQCVDAHMEVGEGCVRKLKLAIEFGESLGDIRQGADYPECERPCDELKS